jgi:tetratricopeptide (TPR) repeat protein
VEALTYQGWALIRDDRVTEGARNLDRAVALDPDFPDVRVFRAVVASRAAEAAAARGDRPAAQAAYAEAASEIDRFFRNDPPEVAVQVLQQELLEFKIFLGLLDETSARCWADALASRGEDVALDQRLYDDLGTCSDAVLAASPDDTDARFTRALAHVGPERQDLASARSEVDRLLSVDPTDANGLLLRASLALAERRNADAGADLDVLDGMARPTASFLLGSPTDLRDVLERSEEAASGSTTTTTTTAPPVSGAVSTVPGAPVIPNAGGG